MSVPEDQQTPAGNARMAMIACARQKLLDVVQQLNEGQISPNSHKDLMFADQMLEMARQIRKD